MSNIFNPGSKNEMLTIAQLITARDKKIIADALRTETSDTSLLKISIRDLPFAKLKILRTAMAKVLVLIPPPVDCGEAPIHIKKNTIMSVGNINVAVLMELNPAVLGVVAPKRAVTTFPNAPCSVKVLLYSRK